MNLMFTPSILALALSFSSAGARRTSGLILGRDLTKQLHSSRKEISNEKFMGRRRAEGISASAVEKGSTHRHKLYYPDVGILLPGMSRHHRIGTDIMNGRRHAAEGVDEHGVDADDVRRFLQADEATLCGTNGTCAPSFCIAMGSHLTAHAAAVEFNAICNGYSDASGRNWTFEGCIADYYKDIPGLLEYARNAYCRIAQCAVEGGTYGACYCQLYHDACEQYGDERPFDVSKNVKVW